MKFIYTSDLNTKKVLEKMGLELIKETDGLWVFINNDTLVFDKVENIIFSNTLTF